MTHATQSRFVRSIRPAAMLLALAVVGACDNFDAANQNFSTLQELTSGNASRVAVVNATQGLIAGMRNSAPGVAQTPGILGREGYNLDVSNPQNVPAFYTTLADISPNWANAYQNIKQANLVITALGGAQGLSDADKEAIRGFAKTVKAYELLRVIQIHDQAGAILEPTDSPTDAPPDIVGPAQVYAHILQLLDEAATHLNAAGATLPITLGPGFAGFDTPAAFLSFNKGLRARVNVYLGNYTTALTDLGGSFVSTTDPLARGVYFTFSTTAGDAQNVLYDPTARQRYAHPALFTDAQKQADGVTLDNRFTSKVRAITPSFQRYGFTVAWTFQRYNSQADPIPVLKNEELILLRAEANIGAGTADAALPDINLVRQQSGGLQAISLAAWQGMSAQARLDELLYNKRYSLVWEGGQRWYDARKYGFLAQLPHDQAGQVVFPYLRIADNECVPRNPLPAGCNNPTGL